MAARRLGNSCLLYGIRIHIPHAESSRQAIIRDSLLRRRKGLLGDVKGKVPLRCFHSSIAGSAPSSATRMRGYVDVEEIEDEDEDLEPIFRAPDPANRPPNPRSPPKSNEGLFDFVPDTSSTPSRRQTGDLRGWDAEDPTRTSPPTSNRQDQPISRSRRTQRFVFARSVKSSSTQRFFDPEPIPQATPEGLKPAGFKRRTVDHVDTIAEDPGPPISYPQSSIESLVHSRIRKESGKALQDGFPLPTPGTEAPNSSESHTFAAPSKPTLTTLSPAPKNVAIMSFSQLQASLEHTTQDQLTVSLGSSATGVSDTLSKHQRAQHRLEARRASHDPAAALRALVNYPPEVADGFTPTTYDKLYVRLDAAQRGGLDLNTEFTREEARQTLEWLCPPSTGSSPSQITQHYDPSYPSEPFVLRTSRGFRFKYFLQLSSWLNCTDLQRRTFNSLYLHHFRNGDTLDLHHLRTRQPVRTTYLVENLSAQLKVYRSWDTIIDLFADHKYPNSPVNFPMQYWTPKLLSKVMLAYHQIGNPAAILPLWDEYILTNRPLPTNAVVYQRVMTAHLKLGNMVDVRRYQLLSREAGFDTETDAMWESWNLLQAQRQYGMDTKLEKQALATIDAASLAGVVEPSDTRTVADPSSQSRLLAAEVLHGLVRLRLDWGDSAGALGLLHHFNLPQLPLSDTHPPPNVARIEPTRKTLILGFEVFSLLQRESIAHHYWALLVKDNSKTMRDSHIARYARHMTRKGQPDKMFRLIDGYFNHSTEGSEDSDQSHILPPGRCEIGPVTMNELLFGMSNKHGIAGLVSAFELMQDHRIPMNGGTIRVILRSLSRNSFGDSEDPVALAATLSFILRQADIPSSVAKDLDVVMSRAINEYNKSQARLPNPVADLDFQHSGVGLRPTESLRSTVKPMISNLTARWLTSESTAFAYRLEFEAMVDTQIGGMPSARYLWNQLIARGYKMSKRHLLGLIKGYTTAGKMEAAESVLELARQADLRITRGMWIAMMRGWTREPDRARECYEEVRRLGAEDPREGLEMVATTHMINIYSHAGQHDQALDLIKRDLGDEDLDDIALRTVGMVYLRVEDPANAVELLHRHRQDQRLVYRLVEVLASAHSTLGEWVAGKRASSREREALASAEQLLISAQELEQQHVAAVGLGADANATRGLLRLLTRSTMKGVPSKPWWKLQEGRGGD